MSSALGGGALQGLRVLDLSRVLAGPLCGQMLGDHGADVIKVESPAGDDTRTYGPPYLADGKSAYFTSINRNKRNLCLDLREAPARGVLWTLLQHADVVVENFKAGTMARWGFGYEEVLAARFPRLVYSRITGYGVDGPLGGLPGYDAVLQAYAGLMSVNGEPDQEPLRIGVPVVDMVTGMLAFSGILLALHDRERSGRGQLVDCTLLDTAVSLLHPHSANWLATGVLPRRTGSAHPTIAPYETFKTRGGTFFLSAANDRQFNSLVNVLGRPELGTDPHFATNTDRLVNVAALREILGRLIMDWDPEALAAELLACGVAAAPVHDVAESLTAPQVLHREMLVSIGDYRGIGIPIKLGRTPGSVVSPPADKGAHTQAVLREAGYSEHDVRQLLAGGSVSDAEA